MFSNVTALSSVGVLKIYPTPTKHIKSNTETIKGQSESEILTCVKNLGKLKLGIREYLKNGYARKSPGNSEAWKV